MGEGVVNWGVGGLRGGNRGALGAVAPPPVSGACWQPGVPQACSERRGSGRLRLTHLGIGNSRQQRGWGKRRGACRGEVELEAGCGLGRGLSGGEGLAGWRPGLGASRRWQRRRPRGPSARAFLTGPRACP